MTLGDRIELAVYRFVEAHGKGQPRPCTLPDLAKLVEGAEHKDVEDALIRLESRGFLALAKWSSQVGKFVRWNQFIDPSDFFYKGEYRITILPNGRQDYERRIRALAVESAHNSKQSKKGAARRYGRWKVIANLAEGGQGHVFLVEDTTHEYPGRWTLKRLKNVNDQARRKRFEREIKAIQAVNHPRILKVIDYELAGERPYFVAEYCELGSLQHLGAADYKGNIRTTSDLLLPLVEALEEVHNEGIVHRDIKPANIFLRPEGTAVIGDFGICFREDGQGVTLSDEGVGSRNFTAPEMESGQRDLGEPSGRTDVYCVGKLIYWLLSGGKEFSREDHRKLSLVTILGEQRFEHIHALLDQMVVREPGERIDTKEVRERLKMTASLVQGNFAPLSPSIGIRCRFCGIGVYKPIKGKGAGFPIPQIGLTAHGDVRLLICSHCGHIEWFEFTGVTDPKWWDK